MPTAPGVLVAHGDGVLLARLCAALPPEVRLVGRARSVAGLPLAVRRTGAAVVVVGDRTLGDVTAAVRLLVDDGCRVLVVADRPEDPRCADLLLAGAQGVLARDALTALPQHLRAVLDGEAALSRHLVTVLLDEYRRRERARTDRAGARAVLTNREAEILELLRRGHRTGEIAERLVVTPATVRSHIASAARKLHVRTRQEALLAVDRGPADRVG
ncbi:response regulator transcription factor [Cellulomonas marina]|uniref:DNA-binding response regulator, NarL/FixJ family, contains REC and HTH domains n=1 Tax=Cellulomonas marina TaxID=988821 RepID=A0A1I0Z8H6_9CELL|nr:LuxR C-terminal-related transcriptional regulator [Cellulomonas marina]GIG29022.1 DNA-binding response regulator [Cellulomonas marina]SFB22059.1 DNA-binding response regulator, NarL/FixJ family, contains REC and HTH domains [Cellulomonas marina]